MACILAITVVDLGIKVSSIYILEHLESDWTPAVYDVHLRLSRVYCGHLVKPQPNWTSFSYGPSLATCRTTSGPPQEPERSRKDCFAPSTTSSSCEGCFFFLLDNDLPSHYMSTTCEEHRGRCSRDSVHEQVRRIQDPENSWRMPLPSPSCIISGVNRNGWTVEGAKTMLGLGRHREQLHGSGANSLHTRTTRSCPDQRS